MNLKLHKTKYVLSDRCEVTWSSVKSCSDLHKEPQALVLSPVFFFFGLQWVAQCLWLALQRIFWEFSLWVSLVL